MEAGNTGESASQSAQGMVTLMLAGPKLVFLPEKTIAKHPKLASQFVTVQDGKKLDLTAWPTAVVHVLIMFLFTGTYQDLHDLDEDELGLYNEPEAMLKRVFQTYLLATEYGLDRLVKLAAHGFDVTSKGMRLPNILDVVFGVKITLDSQHVDLTNTLIQRASDVGGEVDMELDDDLSAIQWTLRNNGIVFGALFSQILEQRARIRDLMHENQRLTDPSDSDSEMD
ncbi:hypothetical protein Neosp_003493 [[Neocosmospora] mangrovei]